jgi:hypothetical protein
MNAIELRSGTKSILLGEPTGGMPNHYGEVRSFQLPNSGLRVQYFTRYFTNLPGSNAPSLAPDLSYPITWADLLAGADPAVEAAIALAGEMGAMNRPYKELDPSPTRNLGQVLQGT